MASNKSEEDALLLSLESVDDSWVLDSSASFHATPNLQKFHKLFDYKINSNRVHYPPNKQVQNPHGHNQ